MGLVGWLVGWGGIISSLGIFLCIYSTVCASRVTPELRFEPRELNEVEEDLLKWEEAFF